MSHPDEALLTTYVDDALTGAARSELDSHLMRCRECRTHVVALRDESAFLGDVLGERERPVPVREAVPETEAGVAIGLPVAIAAVTIVFAVVGALLESRMPGGLDVLHPLRLKGAYEMAFDFIFFLRDSAPGALELIVSLGAVASLSALLSFGVGLLYRRLFGATAGLVMAVALIGGSEPARAVQLELDKETRVASGEVIEESMVITGDRARIDGTVKGDVVATVERLQITGRIEGNLYVFARDLDLTGSVGGSVHMIAQRARIDGEIEGSCMAVAAMYTLTSDGQVGQDAWLLLAHGTLDGRFRRDVLIGGEDVELAGSIERNLDMRFVDQARLHAGARVGGDVDAWVTSEDDFEQDPGAQIGGAVQLHLEEDPGRQAFWDRMRPNLYIAHAIAYAASFAFGLLLFALIPSLFDVGIRSGRDFFRNLLMGFVSLVVPPCAIVLVGLTLVGLPVAVLASFVYITCLYAAELLVAMWIGRTLLGHEAEASLWGFGRVFFVGLVIVFIASHLPYVGKPILLLCVLTGLGLVFERARRLPMFAG